MKDHPVKRARLARGWTQEDLSTKAGVSVRTISSIETRDVTRQNGVVRHPIMRAICAALDVPWERRRRLFPPREAA